MSQYDNPVSATLNGILDLFRKKTPIGELSDRDRLDGKTCLITGANSGLGYATALDLAKRGATLILACRSGIPEAAERLKQASGNNNISSVHLDLSDLHKVDECCAILAKNNITIDRLILNAGLVPQKPAKTAQGFEMMFGVHFLGNLRFVLNLLADGTIPNQRYANNGRSQNWPRIIFVSSESHRSGTAIDMATLGEFVEYSPMGSIAQYGHSKLVMTSFASELAKRLQAESHPDVSVHALCPGPVNSNIAREAPALFKPLLGAVMGVLFASPDKAAAPVKYLACSPDVEGENGLYLHLMVKKDPAPQALDEKLGAEVFAKGEELIQTALQP